MGGVCCSQADKQSDAEAVTVFPIVAVPGGAADQETIGFLSQVKLFQRLPVMDLPLLAAACVRKAFPQGMNIITQGEEGTEFYVIIAGRVSVSIDGKKVTTFSTGDYFGEVALLRDEPRTATITTEEYVQALMVTRQKFQEIGLNEKLEFSKRQAVGGGAGERPLETQPPSTKTAEDRQLIKQCLTSNSNLKEMGVLDDSKVQAICDLCWEQKVGAGTCVIEQGSDGDYFYMVKNGSFEILVDKSGKGQGASDVLRANAERVGVMSKGNSFGELALLYFAPRAATVKAKINGEVWVIDRDNFKKVLAKSADDFAKEHVKYLDTKDVFKDLKADEKLEVAKALKESNFSAGECLFEQGEQGDSFYILIEGEVAVIKDGKQVAKLKGTPGKVEIFGELAILNAENRAATIKAVSDIKTLSMDQMSFELLLGPLKDIQSRGKSGESKVGKGRASVAPKKATAKIYRKDLTRLGLLGCGGFGAVELVEHNKTKETYALKALSKGYIVKCGMKKGVMNEKNIQIMCDNDFIVRLYETYNGEQSFYFLLELALGGELYATYSKKGFHGKVKHAQFYISGTVYAFEHLHSKKIIFRDLKPENLLLTEKGDIKLTDMGLAKVTAGKTYTTCGTPDYFAPEVIASTGHTEAVDWWTLGVLTFELMTGYPPFESASPMQIYSKITKGISKVSFPAKIKGSCEDLVKAMCKKEPSERLPMKKGGINNIMKHSWYKGHDWAAMKSHTLPPPYAPKVKSKKDLTNFSARKEDMPPQIKYTDDGSGWDKDFATSN